MKKKKQKAVLLAKRETKYGTKPSKMIFGVKKGRWAAKHKGAQNIPRPRVGKQCVIYTGNFIYGPFDNPNKAWKWVEGNLSPLSGWMIRPLTNPAA